MAKLMRTIEGEIQPNGSMTDCVAVRTDDGKVDVVAGCGECGSPWTERPDILKEMVRLWNEVHGD